MVNLKVKKKFLDGELVEKVEQIDGDLSDLENSLTNAINNAKAEAVNDAKAYTDEAVNGLDTNHFLLFANTSDFPETGLENKLYLSESNNAMYRYAITQEAGSSYDLTVGPEDDDDYQNIPDAMEAASDGQKILIKAGTYILNAELNVNKSVLLFGEGKGETIVQGNFSTAANTTLVRVSSDNVVFKDIGFRQLAEADNFCIVGETTDASRPGDWVKINNFTMIGCEVQYPKHGVEIRGVNTVIKNVIFKLIEGGSKTRYPLMYSHSEGVSFISGCHFNHPFTLVENNRVIYLRGSGTEASDQSYTGSLVIENNTVEGIVVQFVNHDNLTGSNFEVYLLNNDTRAFEGVCTGDSNAFYVAVGSNPDIYAKVVCEGNKLENKHNAEGLGKGMFFLATTARTTSLPVFAKDNELVNLDLRDTEVTGANSPPALFTVPVAVDYSALDPFDFSDDFSGLSIPTVPADPTATEDSVGEYIELSVPDLSDVEDRIESLENRFDQPAYNKMKIVLGESDLTSIDLQHEAIENSLVVSVGRVMVHLGDDFTVSDNAGVSMLTWTGSLAEDGDEALEVGDTVFVTYAYEVAS